jgi:hypothetical protein
MSLDSSRLWRVGAGVLALTGLLGAVGNLAAVAAQRPVDRFLPVPESRAPLTQRHTPLAAAAYERRLTLSPGQVFSRIHFSGSGELRLRQRPQIEVNAVAAVPLEGLSMEVMDGTLYIDANELAGEHRVRVEVCLPELQALVAAGGSRIRADGFEVDALRLEAEGSGLVKFSNLKARDVFVSGRDAARFELSGAAKRQVIDIDDTGDYRAAGLSSETGEVRVRGAGNAVLDADAFLDVIVSGAARVLYTGMPMVIQRVSDAGRVARVEL